MSDVVFRLKPAINPQSGRIGMMVADDGPYVAWEDHLSALTATQEKLAAAEAQIEADNSRLRYALRDERSRFGLSPSYEDVCSAIGQIEMAMKSLPPAPVRDDARDERLINFAINAEVSYQRRVAVHRTAKEILAAFNTQDNSNE